MCSITMKLRRNYAVTAITLWPVIAKNYGVITRDYDGKITTLRSYDGKIAVTRYCVTVNQYPYYTLAAISLSSDSNQRTWSCWSFHIINIFIRNNREELNSEYRQSWIGNQIRKRKNKQKNTMTRKFQIKLDSEWKIN